MKLRRYKTKNSGVPLTLTAVLATSGMMSAATLTSVGSGDYFTTTTWTPAAGPTPTDDTVITNGDTITSTNNIFVANGVNGAAGTGSITVINGSLSVTEIGLGFLHSSAGTTQSSGTLTIHSDGVVDLQQMWFGFNRGNHGNSIAFVGDGGTLQTDGFGTEGAGTLRYWRPAGTAFLEVINFERLWDDGFLSKDGVTGTDAGSPAFADSFSLATDGTLTAISIPEPSASLLLALSGLGLLGHRRRN